MKIALLTLAAVTLVACGQAGTTSTAPSNATVVSIVVTSATASSSTYQLTATARMSDGTSRDVTRSAIWESSNPLIATVSATGLVAVVTAGELDVRATYQSIVGSLHLLVAKVPPASLSIDGAPAIASGPFQLTASARLTDGTVEDVTRAATWQSSNAQVATVSNIGFVTVVSNGDVDFTVAFQGLSATAHVKITLPQSFTVSGTVTDGTTMTPVAGARVQLIGGGFTMTDDHGAFAMSVPGGIALVEVDKDGYQVWEREIVVASDTTLTVTLAPATPTMAAASAIRPPARR